MRERLKMKKIVLIDIDDTIFDFKKCSFKAFKNTLACLNKNFQKSFFDEFLSLDEKLWQSQKEGILSVDEVIYKRADLTCKKLNLGVKAETFMDIFSKNLANTHEEIKGARDLLSYLSKKYRLYAASNGIYIMQENRLKISKLYCYFNKLYISDKVGFEKPDPKFFLHIKNDLDINKDELIMIGDSYSSDIKGAYNFGIESIYFTRNKKINPKPIYTYKVNKLEDIKKIL